jgi:hypothetical protein
MGCCSSQPDTSSSRNLVQNPTASNGPSTTSTTASKAAGTSASSPGGAAASAKETQIALAFKAKRANVFTASVDTDTRRAFSAKNIPKTPKQELAIRKCQHLVYTTLV